MSRLLSSDLFQWASFQRVFPYRSVFDPIIVTINTFGLLAGLNTINVGRHAVDHEVISFSSKMSSGHMRTLLPSPKVPARIYNGTSDMSSWIFMGMSTQMILIVNDPTNLNFRCSIP